MLPRAWFRSETMPLKVPASWPISSSLSTGALTVMLPEATSVMALERFPRGLSMEARTW